jgi:hypothetical protein
VRRERGSSLFEIVVLGFAVLAMVIPVILTAARLSEASAVAGDEARGIATWVARHGSPPDAEHRSDITIDVDDGVVHVSATIAVELISVAGADVETTVTSRFSMPISPYRSGR